LDILFLYRYADHRDLPSFPTRRSSDLARPPARRIRESDADQVTRRRLALVAAVLLAAACVERVTAPGHCPDFCPSGQITVDTLRSEEHTSELQSRGHLVCRLLLEKKKK